METAPHPAGPPSAPASENAAAGIYLHLPFCRRKCRYCDFYSRPAAGVPSEFITALIREIRRNDPLDRPPDTLYLGGGTPSLATPAQVGRLIDAVAAHFTLPESVEITLEANPETINEATLRGFRLAGVNRLSLGIQSFDQRTLDFLGRRHSVRDSCRAAAAARSAGFDNLALDLICGHPGQHDDAWRRELAQAVALSPAHLSCYLLTYAAGTALERLCATGRIRPLAPRPAARLLRITDACLTAAGFEHYEISNFARPGWRSRHNQKYWDLAPYLGFGPGAHSFRRPRRWWNLPDLDGYLARLAENQSPPRAGERLDREQLLIEALYLGLRRIEGLDLTWFRRHFDFDIEVRCAALLSHGMQRGLLQLRCGRCALTPAGMEVADALTADFVRRI